MALTIAFVMDPIEEVHVAADTTFAFMLAAAARGHRIVHVAPADVTVEHDTVALRGRHIEVADRPAGEHFRVVESVRLPASDCAAVFIRKDPPFDAAYLTLSWLLSVAEEQGVRCINSPRGLRTANEHLYSLMFPRLCPPTLVTSSRGEIRAFADAMGGTVIAKPIDGHAGFGVVQLREGDSNFNALVDLLTAEQRQPIIVQQVLPVARCGDKRLFVVDGEARGAVLRMPQGGDHRGNVHVGGEARACEISEADRAIAAAMRERLRADGLFFVGLDVIDGHLIEVNVTSPTLLRELVQLGGPDIAAEVIASVEAHA